MMKQDFSTTKFRIFAPHAQNQRSSAEEVRSSQKQHALNQRSPTEDKGQKLTEAARPEPTVISRR